jgi:AraC-like DNA-binding protein
VAGDRSGVHLFHRPDGVVWVFCEDRQIGAANGRWMDRAAVEFRNYTGEVERHRHDYHQVILPCAGTLEMEMERGAGRVTGSLASFVAAGCSHAFSAKREDIFIVLDVPTGIGYEEMDDQEVPPFFAFGPEVRSLIDYLIARGLDQPSPVVASSWSTLLLERISDQKRGADRAELTIARALSFMKRNLAEPIRINDIAEAAGVSTTRLYDAFVKRGAATPHAQLTAFRLDAAERLLADPSLSIAEIAVQSGHSDQSALTRTMRRVRGTTPAEVRHCLMAKPERMHKIR